MNHEQYISQFGDISKLKREVLLSEMDRVWDELGLDNRKKLTDQYLTAAQFYSHPVWVLNGLFSEYDPASRGHRKAIAAYTAKLESKRVADYGGGSGVLAQYITETMTSANVEIIEPFPSEYFKRKLNSNEQVKFVPSLDPPYDLIISQDVLEHVDEPMQLALDLVNATKIGGYLIFANCFYPEIKCHLPATFYLRHQFEGIITYAGLKFVGLVPGAEHAQVYQRVGDVDYQKFHKADIRAKKFGSILNMIRMMRSKVKYFLSL